MCVCVCVCVCSFSLVLHFSTIRCNFTIFMSLYKGMRSLSQRLYKQLYIFFTYPFI